MGSNAIVPIHARRGSNLRGLRIAVEYIDPKALVPPSRKLRQRSPRQLKRLARSIEDFGFLVPVLVDEDLSIVAGDGRVEAAKLLALPVIPIIRIDHLTKAQQRLFAIADNVTPQGVDWVPGALTLELKELKLIEPELDLTSSGLSIVQIDTMFGRARTQELADADDVLPPLVPEPVSRVGDRWRLGRHVLGCGDARGAAFLTGLLEGRQARLLLGDAPWNLKIEGVVSGKGKTKHLDFVMAAGEMSRAEFVRFLTEAITAAQASLVDGALVYLFMDWRNLDALAEAAAECGLVQKNLLVWCKDNAGLGLLYRSQHELIALYKYGGAPHTNNMRMGEDGRNRSNLLFYPGANSFGKGRSEALKSHPTSKPVSLLADILLDVTAPGEIVIDPFGGSGSTLIAAERMDRVCVMIELHPPYVDGIIRRYEKLCGTGATHFDTGKTFAEVAAERLTPMITPLLSGATHDG